MIRDVVSFFRGHWPQILVGIPAAFGVTALHELAHCAAVWTQGGTVTDFRRAFGPTRPAFCALGIGFGLLAAAWGFWVNVRLYRKRAVGLPAFGLLAATAALILLAVTATLWR